MSGSKGGVRALLSERMGREIPYLQCMSHQLHLVVVGALAAHKEVRRYFDLCEEMYTFFRRLAVVKAKTTTRSMQH